MVGRQNSKATISRQQRAVSGNLEPLTDDVLRATVEAWRAANECNSEAARQLGVAHSTVFHRLKVARKRGLLPPALEVQKQSILYDSTGRETGRWDKLARPAMDPEDAVRIPEPRTITKVSTLTDQEGRVVQQWVGETPAAVAKEQSWRELAQELQAELPQYKRTRRAAGPLLKDQLACYPVGDHHLGMLSWKRETGASFDLEIGERLLVRAMDHLLESSPACKQALLVFLGDFMHYDGMVPVTPTNRNVLDADGRYPKMVSTAVRCMRYSIDAALKRHGQVHVIIEIGNHDLSSSIFLMECLRICYEKEPRVTIDTSPKHYHYFMFGKVLIGTHHGHGSKMEQLPLIMATDVPQEWGATQHRYIWTGHVHHSSKVVAAVQKDHPGVEVESFRVLPPPDAWAANSGYRPIRDMKAILMHREHGEIARNTVRPDMLA